MAVGAFLGAVVYINTLDASPFVNQVASPMTVDMLDATTVDQAGYKRMVPGLKHGEISMSGFQDLAAGGFYEKVNLTTLGTNSLASITPGSAPVTGDPSCFVYGPFSELSGAVDGTVGDMNTMAVKVNQYTPFCMGVLASPSATRTTNGTGTVFAYAGASATEAWYAGLHVFTGSGGNLVVTVKSDTSVGFGSPTTRLTFTSTAAPTYEVKSVAGSFATATHARVDWTVSAGTFTFAVVLARIGYNN